MGLPMDKPWRFRCPTEKRHANLQYRSDCYYCSTCGKKYEQLYDMLAETKVSVA